MNQKELLKLGEDKLKNANIEYASFKAKRLIEFVLNQTRTEFMVKELEEVSCEKQIDFENRIEELLQNKPLQYITNSQEFMGLEFYVDENVLIPQPDTEILVEEAAKIARDDGVDLSKKNNTNNNVNKKTQNYKKQVLDLCTGSGAIAVSLAHYCKNINVVASDISSKALEVAKKNAKKYNVEERIKFIQSDMFDNIDIQQFDVIVSNPPYIETEVIKTLSKEVQNEPIIALDGGEDGLKFYREILKKADKYLNKNGYLLFEIGYNQGNKILQLYEELKENDKCNLKLITQEPIKDLSGNNRVLIFTKII